MLAEVDQELAIARIGDFLLKGMVLTDLNCSRCKVPTMKSKDKKIVGWCVLCDYVDENVPLDPVEKLQPAAVTSASAVDVSKELGEKLMQGWTMLQECCNNCTTVPLMKSQDEECYCVSCKLWKSVDQNGVHDLTAPVPAAKHDLKTKTEERVVAMTEKVEEEEWEKEVEKVLETTPSNVKSTIREKIELLSSMLAKATYPGEVQQICDAIKSASEALKSLD